MRHIFSIAFAYKSLNNVVTVEIWIFGRAYWCFWIVYYDIRRCCAKTLAKIFKSALSKELGL